MRRLLVSLLSVALLTLASLLSAGMAQDGSSRVVSRSGLPANFDQIFTHAFAPANGVRLHYAIGGPADGPMVVLLPMLHPEDSAPDSSSIAPSRKMSSASSNS